MLSVGNTNLYACFFITMWSTVLLPGEEYYFNVSSVDCVTILLLRIKSDMIRPTNQILDIFINGFLGYEFVFQFD